LNGKGKIARIALTPPAAVADVVIVGSVVGAFLAVLYAEENPSP